MARRRVNGTELHYELRGTGEPLVLVHGSWSDARRWRAVAEALASSFTVLTYDRRGHSRSERPRSWAVRDNVDDLAALLEALDLTPAHVAGNSLGASVSLWLAAARPELLRSLTVHEPPLFALLDGVSDHAAALADVRSRVGAVLELLQAGEMEAGARRFAETMAFGPGAWEGFMSSELREAYVANAPAYLVENRGADMAEVETGALADFPHPALVTDGAESPPFFRAVVERVAALLPQARRRTLQGAGHVPHTTHPDDYARMLHAFLAPARVA